MTKIEYNKDLTALNTFGMKVKAACYLEYDSVEDLFCLFRDQGEASSEQTSTGVEGGFSPAMAQALPRPLLHIGGGSNLLFTKDFPGTVLHSAIKTIGLRGFELEAGAGVLLDDLCRLAAGKGLWGLENLSAIPGEVGAAAVQNVGAYGVEIKDVIEKVNCFDTVLCRMVSFTAAECGYGYRDSLFKTDRKGRYIITSVVFRMDNSRGPILGYGHLKDYLLNHLEVEEEQEEQNPNIREEMLSERLSPGMVRKAIIEIRSAKLPAVSEVGSAGSFFKNPVVPRSALSKVQAIASGLWNCEVPHYDVGSGFVKIPAAWLIEHCGWKGHVEGNVGVWKNQPLVIVNLTGAATPSEVIALENKIIASVKALFDIDLTPEVEHI